MKVFVKKSETALQNKFLILRIVLLISVLKRQKALLSLTSFSEKFQKEQYLAIKRTTLRMTSGQSTQILALTPSYSSCGTRVLRLADFHDANDTQKAAPVNRSACVLPRANLVGRVKQQEAPQPSDHTISKAN